MGSGAWSPATYNNVVRARAAAGVDTFDYSAKAHRSGVLRVHQTLDPQGLATRESRDSQEHPNSNAIFISLDVTGSMDRVVRGIHRDLPRLHELLIGQNYIQHPQILFGAVGDATCDRVPLQIGQFESDNRMDQNLENMILEGGGGGQKTESYELAMYVAARHTAIDCWDKRQHKGYLFIIGDEMAYPFVRRDQVNRIIGGGIQEDLPVSQIVTEVRRRYHLHFVIPGMAAHGQDHDVLEFWEHHLGAESVIHLDSPEQTSESIGVTIGVREGSIDLSQAAALLHKRGAVMRTVDRLIGSLGTIMGKSPTTKPSDTRRL